MQADQLKSLNAEGGDSSESEESIIDAILASNPKQGIDDSMEEAQDASLLDPSEASSTGFHPDMACILTGPLTPLTPEHILDQPHDCDVSHILDQPLESDREGHGSHIPVLSSENDRSKPEQHVDDHPLQSQPEKPPSVQVPKPAWNGFKVVGDNMDKTIKPRDMRSDRQTVSVHYFQLYAVRDRVNCASIPDTPRPTSSRPPLEELLPSPADHEALTSNMAFLVARILTSYMPFFRDNFSDIAARHISHPYVSEMSQKS